jgi:hypothetical protein
MEEENILDNYCKTVNCLMSQNCVLKNDKIVSIKEYKILYDSDYTKYYYVYYIACNIVCI